MNGIDGMRIRGTVAGRCLRTGRRAVAGTVLLAGAMFGVASQPAFAAAAPAGSPAQVAVVVTCGGLTEAAAQAAGYTIHNNAASPVAVIDLGGPGPDWMVGSAFNDILDAQGGNDLLCGRNGNDDLRGLSGDDTIFGGAGNDAISGDSGVDVGNGGSGLSNTCTVSTETQNNC
jgi:Ca2+-binding RTX toxin-like protein